MGACGGRFGVVGSEVPGVGVVGNDPVEGNAAPVAGQVVAWEVVVDTLAFKAASSPRPLLTLSDTRATSGHADSPEKFGAIKEWKGAC